jgi:hypothetical protein
VVHGALRRLQLRGRVAAPVLRVAHEPWRQSAAELLELDCELLSTHWPWFRDARCVGANYSPGLREVGMGFPERC